MSFHAHGSKLSPRTGFEAKDPNAINRPSALIDTLLLPALAMEPSLLSETNVVEGVHPENPVTQVFRIDVRHSAHVFGYKVSCVRGKSKNRPVAADAGSRTVIDGRIRRCVSES